MALGILSGQLAHVAVTMKDQHPTVRLPVVKKLVLGETKKIISKFVVDTVLVPALT